MRSHSAGRAQTGQSTPAARGVVRGKYWTTGLAFLVAAGLIRAAVPQIASSAEPPSGAIKLPTPRVNYRMDEASASTAPWVNTNGWRILRNPGANFFYDAPGPSAALAAAEAFEFSADATIHTDATGQAPLEAMVAFLRTLPSGAGMKPLVNIGLHDDGTPRSGEVMNLLIRRNLLFDRVTSPEPGLLDVKLGSSQFPASLAANPDVMAHLIRQNLGDDKRLLRIYGSEVVIGRLDGDSSRALVHLLNYDGARRHVEGLRIRVLGHYTKARAWASGLDPVRLLDVIFTPEAAEFTLPELNIYALVELER